MSNISKIINTVVPEFLNCYKKQKYNTRAVQTENKSARFFYKFFVRLFHIVEHKERKKAERNVSVVKRLLTTKNVRHLNTTIYLIFIYS